jgi:MOSC domain-containing protein YiiM
MENEGKEFGPEKLANKKGFEKAFEGRGGLRAEVMTEGIISVGDEIVV